VEQRCGKREIRKTDYDVALQVGENPMSANTRKAHIMSIIRIGWAKNGATLILGGPFVKRFALCYRSVVCLSLCNVRALWPNGWTDQDETWHARRPRPWPHCVRWGPSSPSPKGHRPHPIFGPYLLRSNGCMDQDATWYGGRPQPRGLCVRWEVGTQPAPKFSSHVYYSYCDFVRTLHNAQS